MSILLPNDKITRIIYNPDQLIPQMVWAFIKPEEQVYTGAFACEEEAWQIGLGWPTAQEIEKAKAKGYRVQKVIIFIPKVTV